MEENRPFPRPTIYAPIPRTGNHAGGTSVPPPRGSWNPGNADRPSTSGQDAMHNPSLFKKYEQKKHVGLKSISAPRNQVLLSRITTRLVQCYQHCDPCFKWDSSARPRRALTKPCEGVANEGFDNENSDLILHVGDVLTSSQGTRYIVQDILGQGTFGQVAKCMREDTNEVFAVKVIKNRPAYYHQARVEIGIVQMLNTRCDPEDKHHIIRMFDYFQDKKHLCLVFELLNINLYELVRQNQFRGLSMNLLRLFVCQILDALIVLRDASIVHCDLKPENILLKSLDSGEIKVIDYGSACFENRTVYSYIQSRFYRSPEVLLGYPYSAAIDMWSLGCVAAELFLGLPLFPGASEYNLLQRIIEALDSPPDHMLCHSAACSKYFKRIEPNEEPVIGADGTPHTFRIMTQPEFEAEHGAKVSTGKRYFKFTKLTDLVEMRAYKEGLSEVELAKERQRRAAFLDFLLGIMKIDPSARWTPRQAARHPFITGAPFTQPFQPPPDTTRSISSPPLQPQPPPHPATPPQMGSWPNQVPIPIANPRAAQAFQNIISPPDQISASVTSLTDISNLTRVMQAQQQQQQQQQQVPFGMQLQPGVEVSPPAPIPLPAPLPGQQDPNYVPTQQDLLAAQSLQNPLFYSIYRNATTTTSGPQPITAGAFNSLAGPPAPIPGPPPNAAGLPFSNQNSLGFHPYQFSPNFAVHLAAAAAAAQVFPGDSRARAQSLSTCEATYGRAAAAVLMNPSSTHAVSPVAATAAHRRGSVPGGDPAPHPSTLASTPENGTFTGFTPQAAQAGSQPPHPMLGAVSADGGAAAAAAGGLAAGLQANGSAFMSMFANRTQGPPLAPEAARTPRGNKRSSPLAQAGPQGMDVDAVGPAGSENTPPLDDTPPPDPGDWDPLYSDELLLHDESQSQAQVSSSHSSVPIHVPSQPVSIGRQPHSLPSSQTAPIHAPTAHSFDHTQGLNRGPLAGALGSSPSSSAAPMMMGMLGTAQQQAQYAAMFSTMQQQQQQQQQFFSTSLPNMAASALAHAQHLHAQHQHQHPPLPHPPQHQPRPAQQHPAPPQFNSVAPPTFPDPSQFMSQLAQAQQQQQGQPPPMNPAGGGGAAGPSPLSLNPGLMAAGLSMGLNAPQGMNPLGMGPVPGVGGPSMNHYMPPPYWTGHSPQSPLTLNKQHSANGSSNAPPPHQSPHQHGVFYASPHSGNHSGATSGVLASHAESDDEMDASGGAG